MARIHDHPLIRHKLARLRDKDTPPPEFRALVRQLATLVGIEATRDLPTLPARVVTPLVETNAERLAGGVGLVPILRAGLGMAEGLLDLIPEAEVWHVGVFRDEATLRPSEYYNRIPERSRMTTALVLDPMLATGGSAIHVCGLLRRAGVARIKLLSLIAAPEGVSAMERADAAIEIHAAALDERLNESGYIVPGLGDAGDRQFDTYW